MYSSYLCLFSYSFILIPFLISITSIWVISWDLIIIMPYFIWIRLISSFIYWELSSHYLRNPLYIIIPLVQWYVGCCNSCIIQIVDHRRKGFSIVEAVGIWVDPLARKQAFNVTIPSGLCFMVKIYRQPTIGAPTDLGTRCKACISSSIVLY